MTHTLEELQNKFSKSTGGSSVSFSKGEGNLTFVELKTSKGASAKIYLHGAHVTSFRDSEGKELMFLSAKAIYQNGTSIRGGVPICWPQFADEGTLPMHGFVHDREWQLEDTFRGGDVSVTFSLVDSEETRKIWPHSFKLLYTVKIDAGYDGKEKLTLQLRIENTGTDTFEWSGALHTYFHVNDLTKTHVSGLKGVTYIDKTKQKQKFEEKNEKITFDSEIDRIFVGGAHNTIDIVDNSDKSVHYRVNFTGFSDAVMWNPWTEKAKEIPDFVAPEWQNMICVEGTQLSPKLKVEPKQQWEGSYSVGRV